MKKYCKIPFLVLLAVLTVPCFFSCSDDTEDVVVNMNPPQYESVSGKYEITDSSSPYASIELGASGDYVVIKRSGGYAVSSLQKGNLFSRKAPASRAVAYDNVVYGTYIQIDDETFNLEGFGVIQLKSNGGQGITDVIIKPNGGNEMTFAVKKAATMGDDDLTNALCRTWKVTNIHERGYDSYDGEYDDTYTPDEYYGAISEVMFSKSGTFLSFYNDNEIEAHFWKWENQGERQIRYSWDNVWNNDDEEGNFTVNFSSDNRLTIHEYYRDYETGEWYESTVELVEKNPSGSDGDEGDVTVPTDRTPVERVFTGKLVSEVDDHGLDKFVYENGFLTQVDDGDGYKITFEYYYLDPDKQTSDPDVRYTRERADGSVSYIYDVWLNELGFARRIDSKHNDEYGGFEFQSTCEYDEEGHLVYMNEGREEREYSLVWTDGDISHIDIQGSHSQSTDFSYFETLNDNNLMFFYDIYDMDIEELKYLYWAGLLGVSPKHLVTMSNSDDEHYQFEWESDKVLYRSDGGNSWTDLIHFTFAD
ncbi:DUF4595 domain-containing protein [Bacteroidales bacterium SW299]|nr:DUF4595 domain-containing protein [Bacteroidales bacterium SW299]